MSAWLQVNWLGAVLLMLGSLEQRRKFAEQFES